MQMWYLPYLPRGLAHSLVRVGLDGVAELHRGALLKFAVGVLVTQRHAAAVLPQVSFQLVQLLLWIEENPLYFLWCDAASSRKQAPWAVRYCMA